MKLTDYKRKVYKLMDAEGLPRADAGYFGNLTKRSTWETIESFCEYNAKLDTEAKYTPDEYMRLIVNTQQEAETITLSFDKQPEWQTIETESTPVPGTEVCKTAQDYSLEDLIREVQAPAQPTQPQASAQLPDSAFVPQEWSNNDEQLPRIITMEEFNALFTTTSPTPNEQTNEAQAKTVLQNSKKWYERPAILIGLFAALMVGSFFFTVGYRSTNGGNMAPVQVTTEK